MTTSLGFIPSTIISFGIMMGGILLMKTGDIILIIIGVLLMGYGFLMFIMNSNTGFGTQHSFIIVFPLFGYLHLWDNYNKTSIAQPSDEMRIKMIEQYAKRKK